MRKYSIYHPAGSRNKIKVKEVFKESSLIKPLTEPGSHTPFTSVWQSLHAMFLTNTQPAFSSKLK